MIIINIIHYTIQYNTKCMSYCYLVTKQNPKEAKEKKGKCNKNKLHLKRLKRNNDKKYN